MKKKRVNITLNHNVWVLLTKLAKQRGVSLSFLLEQSALRRIHVEGRLTNKKWKELLVWR